jgi:putative DNA primase/helicase
MNVAGPTLASLATNFGLATLVGKQLAVVSDARLSSGRYDLDIIIERLLAITGEDWVSIDRKYMSAVMLKLHCRFMLLTNEIPQLSDASGALASRFLLLHTPQSWYGKEDTGLTARLLKELPGILLWAVKGWARLQEIGRFEQAASGKELLEEMGDQSSPTSMFVRECCVVEESRSATVAELFGAWTDWCEANNRKPGNRQTFSRNLLAAVPSLHQTRPRSDGARIRGYEGIGLEEQSRAPAPPSHEVSASDPCLFCGAVAACKIRDDELFAACFLLVDGREVKLGPKSGRKYVEYDAEEIRQARERRANATPKGAEAEVVVPAASA